MQRKRSDQLVLLLCVASVALAIISVTSPHFFAVDHRPLIDPLHVWLPIGLSVVFVVLLCNSWETRDVPESYLPVDEPGVIRHRSDYSYVDMCKWLIPRVVVFVVAIYVVVSKGAEYRNDAVEVQP